jgi:hypothetical protein
MFWYNSCMSDIKKPIPTKEEYFASKTPKEHLNDFFQMHLPLIHGMTHSWHKQNAQGLSDEGGNKIDPEDLYLPAYAAFHEAVGSYNPSRVSNKDRGPMSWNNYLNQSIKYKLKKYVDDATGYTKNKAAAAKIAGEPKN